MYLCEEPQLQSELRVPTPEKAAFYLDAALNARTSSECHFLYSLHVYQYSVAGKGGGKYTWTENRSNNNNFDKYSIVHTDDKIIGVPLFLFNSAPQNVFFNRPSRLTETHLTHFSRWRKKSPSSVRPGQLWESERTKCHDPICRGQCIDSYLQWTETFASQVIYCCSQKHGD